MALTYNTTTIGRYVQNHNGNAYKCEIRQGNVEGGVFIYLYEENGETYAQLRGFIDGKQHANNMIKSKCDLFEGCDKIRLNLYFKESKIIMDYAIKMKHIVEVYYDKN